MITDTGKKIYKAHVKRIEKVSKSTYFIEIEPREKQEIKAGQFISVYCDGLTLRRPFSVFSNNNGNIGILFKERGKGTAYIKSLKEGNDIDIIGPLGKGFSIKPQKALLIGAGIGIAPMAFLKEKLDKIGAESLLAAGFLNKDEIPSNVYPQKIYTDDGSYGEKGSILNYLGLLINEFKPEIIYACGPQIVLKSVSRIAQEYNIQCEIAMEKVMACGIGVCRGCVIDIKKDGKVVNATVCKDGPVFNGNEVVWQ